MATIKAQKIPRKSESADKILAQFCYYYPAYTFKQAEQLPHYRVQQMLKVANQENARMLYILTQIAAGPHTTKGKGTKDMLKLLKSIIDGE